jgi:hypothetical protein
VFVGDWMYHGHVIVSKVSLRGMWTQVEGGEGIPAGDCTVSEKAVDCILANKADIVVLR